MNSNFIKIGAGVFIIATIGGLIAFFARDSLFPAQKPIARIETTPTTTPTATTVPSTTPVTSDQKLKDGTYTAQGSYSTPERDETIGVTVTISNETITSVSIENQARDRDSKTYQSLFSRGISSVVVGKKIKDITFIGEVNGSSLTGAGFVQALGKIITQATQ